jgi:anaerobic ribonucleoside-triphosphate reductase
LKSIFEEEATTKRTIRNIKKSLRERIKTTYTSIQEEDIENIVDSILKIHGMAPENFDVINFVETLINQKLNDVSVDDNSNKNEKTISGITAESTKAFDKAVGYDYLYRQMVEDYGKKEAKRLSGLMYDYTLALSDSSKILLPYCFAIDTTKLVFQGRPFGQLKSLPPKRITSYIAALNETAHQLGSHLAGAIAFSTLFLDMVYILLYRENKKIKDIEFNDEIRKYVENSFQSLIHSVNHLSRSGAESIFTNVSIFDKPKLESILANDNMWWMFEVENKNGYTKDEIIYTIQLLQDIYLDLVDKGDPSANGMPIRFPIHTINLSKENGEILDKEFLNKIIYKDIFRYNIFVSKGTKVASCCFHRDQKFITNKGIKCFADFNVGDKIKVLTHAGTWQDAIVNSYGTQPLYDLYLRGEDSIEKITCTKNHEWILSDEKRTNILKIGDILYEAPNNAFYMPKEWKVYAVEDALIYDEVFCLEVENDHSFILDKGIVTSNCRLINDSELMEIGGESNSFGGTQISLGSHRVLTINFNRLALLSNSEEEFNILYEEAIENTLKILKSHKNLIAKTEKAGLQPFITNGWIRMDRLFSTIGILGIYEADITMKHKFGNEEKDYISDWLKFLNSKIPELAKENNLIINIEQIPGESMSPRLANVDTILYGKKNVPFEMYSNQFIPLWEDATIYERMDADGRYNSLITGGGIVHFNLGEKTIPEQNKALIEYAVKSGSEHFALNAVYCKCKKGHMSFGNNKKCPICGEDIEDRLTRVVGFFTPVSSWGTVRREWEFPKRIFKKIK